MTQEEREKWFIDNQWFIDAIREGREVIGYDVIETRGVRGVANGIKLNSWFPFIVGCDVFPSARPIPQKQRRYLGPIAMMRWLVTHGYKPNYGGGWTCFGSFPFSPVMWQYCDTPVVEFNHGYSYHNEWIEEVDE